ncbi:hypothetical protein [Kitasatospora sp. NPDC004289]
MSHYPSLAHGVTDALVDLTWHIATSSPQQMDPDHAVKALELIGTVIERMTEDQQTGLLQVLGELHTVEDDSDRAGFLRAFPECYGLVD